MNGGMGIRNSSTYFTAGAPVSRGHAAELALRALDPESDEAVRATRAREAAETLADLADLVRLAPVIIGGSRAVDQLRASVPLPDKSGAAERIAARRVADELRAQNLTTDTPGALPRPTVLGRGTLGVGSFPLVRQLAMVRSNDGSGKSPDVPGLATGGVVGEILAEGGAATLATRTIADVGGAAAWKISACVATLSRQVLDWTDDDAGRMLDELFVDVADRGAEASLAASLIAAAGGTRVAGADVTAYGLALDAAEKAAAAAVLAQPEAVLVHPGDVAKTRRATAQSWTTDPHPTIYPSAGVPAGTAVVAALDAVHLFVAESIWLTQTAPSVLGVETGAYRPFYLAVRAAAGIQLVTAV